MGEGQLAELKMGYNEASFSEGSVLKTAKRHFDLNKVNEV